MKKFRKLNTIVEAIRYNTTNIRDCINFIGNCGYVIDQDKNKFVINTNIGDKEVKNGYWIVNEDGIIFVYTPYMFNKLFIEHKQYRIDYETKSVLNSIVVDEIVYKCDKFIIVKKENLIFKINNIKNISDAN